MTLWRVLVKVAPTDGKRKTRVHEYVVLAECAEFAEKLAKKAYRPEPYEQAIVTAEPWGDDTVLRRTYLD